MTFRSRKTSWCLENETGVPNCTFSARETCAVLLPISVSFRDMENEAYAEHVLHYGLTPKFKRQ